MIVNKIAMMNGRDAPDITELVEQARIEDAVNVHHRYSVLDLFKTREGIIKSTALLFIWYATKLADT